MKKVVFIFARLTDEPEVYKNKGNADIEEEILREIGSFSYLAKIEKVTVLDYDEIEAESEGSLTESLQKHGLSENVAKNVVRFYHL